MQDKKSIEKFFQTQNITIRKSIRQLDMGYQAFNSLHSNQKRSDVNILVVGPPHSGKSTLLRTLHYALNGNLSCYLETRQISDVCFDRYEIKKNKKCAIEGLTKVKQTDQKLGVFGYEINFGINGNQYKNAIQKYARALEFLNSRTLGCIGHSISSLSSINYVIICLNMIEKVPKDEAMALRYFIGELEEKKMKFTIVGTHVDQILCRDTVSIGSQSKRSKDQEQSAKQMDDWKKYIQSEFSQKFNLDIYCMENYANICKKEEFENSETINYYALSLLEKCIKKAPESDKAKKINLSSKFFCF